MVMFLLFWYIDNLNSCGYFVFYDLYVFVCIVAKQMYNLYRKMTINLYHSLGIFSRRQIDDIFLIFPRKQDLTFYANCLLRRQFA